MEVVKKYLQCIIGCTLMAVAINGFISPHGFVSGGFSGLAMALNKIINIQTGTWIIILNVPLFILALRLEGWFFVVNGIATVFILGIVVDITEFIPMLCPDILVSAIIGGVIEGVGVGICYRSKMTSGGTELLARLLLHRFRWITPGNMLMILALVVIVISTLIIGEYTMIFYSLIGFFVSGKASDLIIVGGNQAKICQIVSERGEQIAKRLLEASYRGVTICECKGAYSNTNKNILMSVVSPKQVSLVVDEVKKIDQNAFVIISDVSQVLGKGFNLL